MDALQPDRPDEMARIKAAGGKVMYMNGARVRGILAMSRALGILSFPFLSTHLRPLTLPSYVHACTLLSLDWIGLGWIGFIT